MSPGDRAAADAAHQRAAAARRAGDRRTAEREARQAIELERSCGRPARLGNHLMFLVDLLRGDPRGVDRALEVLALGREALACYRASLGDDHGETDRVRAEVRALPGAVEEQIATAVEERIDRWLRPDGGRILASLEAGGPPWVADVVITLHKSSSEHVTDWRGAIGESAIDGAARALIAQLDPGSCDGCGGSLSWVVAGVPEPQLACPGCGAMFDGAQWRA